MADIKRLFVSGEIAKLAQEAGFNEECFAWYSFGDSGIGKLVLGRVKIARDFTDGFRDWTGQPIPNPGDPFYPAPMYQQLIDWLAARVYIEDSVLRIIFLYSSNTLEDRLKKTIENLKNGKK